MPNVADRPPGASGNRTGAARDLAECTALEREAIHRGARADVVEFLDGTGYGVIVHDHDGWIAGVWRPGAWVETAEADHDATTVAEAAAILWPPRKAGAA
jgi:hypothetical protein